MRVLAFAVFLGSAAALWTKTTPSAQIVSSNGTEVVSFQESSVDLISSPKAQPHL